MATQLIIIDDEPWSREVVKNLTEWERLGITLAGEAEDGDEGLELLRSVHPEIAVVDMRMPGMDGTELLLAIHEEFPETRIVVMSGHSDFAYLRQALRSRARDYLIKPIDPAELNQTLERCVAELTDGHGEKPTSMRTPVAFQDAAVLEEYVQHRHRIFAYLLELDQVRVRSALQGLQRFLETRAGGVVDDEMSSRIVHDFLLMMEEFVVRSDVAPDPAIFRRRGLEAMSPTDIAAQLAAIFDEAIEAIREARRFKDHLEIDAVTEHIDHYFQEPLSLETVAKLFLVSKEHLSRKFREACGETVHEYITRKRMERAHRLIVEDGVEIKETAFLVGYADLAYFYRVFKKHFGVPPGQIRQQASGGSSIFCKSPR
ncbi:MAG: response regulator [Alkalispirochaeta sp.]